MTQITLDIGGRSYQLGCRDGEEDHLVHLATMIDAKCAEATDALGVMAEPRLLLTAALLIADELTELQSKRAPMTAEDDGSDRAITALADHLETLCIALEQRAARP